MKTVITYGTFDLFHKGHENILRRAKELGDFLIVGVTSDAFDFRRGKLSVRQSTIERVKNVEFSGYADKVIIEEEEDQKINDIIKYNVDTIVLGSDWFGKIDYLKQYCNVVYLPRTEGISSTLLRNDFNIFQIGLIGTLDDININCEEINFLGLAEVKWIISKDNRIKQYALDHNISFYNSIKDSNLISDLIISNNEYFSSKELKEILKTNSVYISNINCLNIDEILSIKKYARNYNNHLYIAPYYIYNPLLLKLNNIIKCGTIGNIIDINIQISYKVCNSLYIFAICFIVNKYIFNIFNENMNNSIFDNKEKSYFIFIKNMMCNFYLKTLPQQKRDNIIIISGTKGQIVIKQNLKSLTNFKIYTDKKIKTEQEPEFVCKPRFAYLSIIKSKEQELQNEEEFLKFAIYLKGLLNEK